MRIVHLSDVHLWRYAFKPWQLANKRAIGMFELVLRRARKFRLERLKSVVERIASLDADHLLITGDLSTTALFEEFQAGIDQLGPLLRDPSRVTVIPGNHDRYTNRSVRHQSFEAWYGKFAPKPGYPWLRTLDDQTAILGLDPTRAHLSATGRLPEPQFVEAQRLLAHAQDRPRRLIIACHYPVSAPPLYADELQHKRMKNAEQLKPWLSALGPHLYCCGHVHAAWAFQPKDVTGELCLNAGSPLLLDPTGLRPPGFLEITLHDSAVSVNHHAWVDEGWAIRPLFQQADFFEAPAIVANPPQPTCEATRI